VVKVIKTTARRIQAIFDGVTGKSAVVFFAGKPLLLGCSDNLTVTQQRGCAVVVIRRDSQNMSRRVQADT
jgi:hypothetical protein